MSGGVWHPPVLEADVSPPGSVNRAWHVSAKGLVAEKEMDLAPGWQRNALGFSQFSFGDGMAKSIVR